MKHEFDFLFPRVRRSSGAIVSVVVDNTNAASREATTPKVPTFSLWLVQVLLALAFGMAGIMKSTMPIAQLSQNLAWTGVVPLVLVRFIGCCELAGALGLIVPAIARIKPILTPLAAAMMNHDMRCLRQMKHP